MTFLVMPVLWLGIVMFSDNKLNTEENKQKYGEIQEEQEYINE